MMPNNNNHYFIQTIQTNFAEFFKKIATETVTTQHVTYTHSDIPHPSFNAILTSKIDPNLIPKAIDEIRTSYERRKQNFWWWVNETTSPSNLADLLQKTNFKKVDAFQGMAIDLTTYDESSTFPADLVIRPIKNQDEFDLWINPIKTAFHFDDSVAEKYKNRFIEHAENNSDFQHYLAFWKQQPVGAATLFFDEISRTAGLYNLAVIPDARHRGIGTAIQHYRLMTAKKLGYKTAVLQASNQAYRLDQKTGFKPVMTFTAFSVNI